MKYIVNQTQNRNYRSLLLHRIDKVFILGRNRLKYNAALEEWRKRPGIALGEGKNRRMEFVECDLADIPSVRDAAEWIKRRAGRLHIVICNAGTGLSYAYQTISR